MIHELISVLQSTGHSPVNLGGELLVLPFAGRVIGLYPRPDKNAVWVNPALESVATAKAYLEDPGWINIGGDRTWISPEIDTHIKNPESIFDGYEVPKTVDPAAYSVTARDDRSITLTSPMEVPFRRSGETIGLTISRTIELLDSPPFELPGGMDFVGYRQKASLTIDGSAKARPALWNILQVPGGGRIEIPVQAGACPRAFIGEPVYELDGEWLRCRVETEASFKFSVVAGDSRGAMLYINDSSSPELLVVRRFPVCGAKRYSDVSCTDLEDIGHVQQVYIDDGALGGFGELEYHSPAIDSVTEKSVTDTSEVWAFSGMGVRKLLHRGAHFRL